MYSREDQRGWEQSAAFKKAFSIDVDIELIGVWSVERMFSFFFVYIHARPSLSEESSLISLSHVSVHIPPYSH